MKIKPEKVKYINYILTASIIIIIGFLISLFTYYDFKNKETVVFNLERKVLYDELFKRTAEVEANIKSFQALYHSVEIVDADMFRIYSEEFLQKHPNITTISFSPVVKKVQKARFEEEQQYWGNHNYKIFTSSENINNSFYLPILNIEPFNPNTSKMLGLDIYSNKILYDVINKSIDSGNMFIYKTSNSEINLIMPIYEGKRVPSDPNVRKGSLYGILFFIVDAEKMLDGLKKIEDIEFTVNFTFDNKTLNLFDNQVYIMNHNNEILNLSENERINTSSQTLSIDFNKKLFLSDLELDKIFIGVVVFLLLSYTVYYFSKSHLILEKKVLNRTEDLLNEKEKVQRAYDNIKELLDLQDNIVIVIDSEELTFANKKFFEFLGYTDLNDFKSHHKCICEFFLENDRFFHLGKINKNQNWIDEIQLLSQSERIVSILKKNSTPHSFSISINKLQDNMLIITFSDISQTIQEYIKMENKTTHDKLTNAYNREYFEQNINELIEKYNSPSNSLAIALLDIDHFKSVNDKFGHDVGDEVLIHFVKTILKFSREDDLFIRWGGEEFILVLKVKSRDDLYKALEHLRKVIEIQDFPVIGQKTCSIGGTIFKNGEDIQKTIKRADEAVYDAKAGGRNIVVLK